MKPSKDNESNWSEENSLLLFLKDSSSTRSSSNLSIIEKNKDSHFLKLTSKSTSHIFPLIYFFSSSLFLLILLFVNLYKERETKQIFESLPINPFPSLFTLKEMEPRLFSFSIFVISVSGFLNVWFFTALLLQRFSVPELKSNKGTVHLMFILGILGNIIYIFFGFYSDVLKLEHQNKKTIKVSLSMIIFLSYIFFNILFATLTLLVFKKFRSKITISEKRLQRNIKVKKSVVYLTIFVCFIFISCLFLNSALNEGKHIKENKHLQQLQQICLAENKLIQGIIFISPYLLFLLNAVINLTYYLDIRYLDDIINIVVDKEFFLTNDESSLLLGDINI